MSTLRTDTLQSTDSTFTIAVKDLANGISVSTKSITGLLTTPQLAGIAVVVKGYSAGSTKGGDTFYWDASKAKSAHDGGRVISPTVPWNGSKATLLDFLNGVGESAPGGTGCWVRAMSGSVLFEMFGIDGVGDEGALLSKVISLGYAEGFDIYGHNSYTTSVELNLPEVAHPSAPIFRDFNKMLCFINQLTFTGTSGNCIAARSPVAVAWVRRLIGPGTGAGTTSGFYNTGLGDGNHRVDWVGGFTNGINFDNCYSNTITVGWVEDCIRGVRINGNANKIWGGHIGGSFVTAAISPTSCEIGIDILSGSSANEIHANVEYCRRSANSIGIQDFGVGTIFVGYTESCAQWNIYAGGKNGNYKVLAGGTNVGTEQSGYFAGDSNVIELLTQTDYTNELIDGANATLAFTLLQTFSTNGNGIIRGPRGLDTTLIESADMRNFILSSSLLSDGAWSSNALGSANWGSVTIGQSAVALPSRGMVLTSRLTFPGLPGDSDIYRKSQGGLSVPAGPASMGLFVKCESGAVDVMVRITTGARQTRHVASVGPTDGFIRIGTDFTNTTATTGTSTFEISFRSYTASVIEVGGCYLTRSPKVSYPVINGPGQRTPVPGSEIIGNTVYNGLNLNGLVRRNASGLINGATTLDASTIVESLYMVAASGVAYNIILGIALDGTEILLKRDGSVGTVNILPGAGAPVDGSMVSIPLTTAYSSKKLIYTVASGWLSI